MLRRQQVLEFFVNYPTSLIGIEACGSSQYWARELIALGHEVKLLNARHVKAFVKGNKNDFNVAEAIFDAVSRLFGDNYPVRSATMHHLLSGAPNGKAVFHRFSNYLLFQLKFCSPFGS